MVRVLVPRVFRWSAPVWQAEVDAFGELRTSTLLKFLQEIATRASSDAGFDPAYYVQTGTMWLVRRTTLTLDAPARYGDELDASTWIADFRRVRSQRVYDVRAADRRIAQATTDWVYVDRERSRPRTIPAEMQRVFVPEGAPARRRVPMPEDAPPAGATVISHRVAAHELDALAHVNNAHYVHYLETAALVAATSAGWPLPRQLELGGRLRPVTYDLEYLDGALFDEVLTIASWPTAVGGDRLERATLVTRARTAEPLLRSTSAYAWTGIDGERGAIPPPLRDALAQPGAASPAS